MDLHIQAFMDDTQLGLRLHRYHRIHGFSNYLTICTLILRID